MFFLVKGQNMTLQTYSNANFISEFNFESKSLIKHSGSTSKKPSYQALLLWYSSKKSNCCLLSTYFDTGVGTLLCLSCSKCYSSVLHMLPMQVQTHPAMLICWFLTFMWDDYTHNFGAELL